MIRLQFNQLITAEEIHDHHSLPQSSTLHTVSDLCTDGYPLRSMEPYTRTIVHCG